MKNLNLFNGNPFDVYLASVANKNTIAIQTRLNLIVDNIRNQYTEYENQFNNHNLEHLNSIITCPLESEALRSLYGYQTAIIREVRSNIEQQQVDTIRTTCQNCSLDSVSSFDHILPIGDFPEFSVNPYNLFPSCSICNGYKSAKWLIHGRRRFLNLFLDTLPEEQYLFLNIENDDNDEIKFDFFLENRNDIDPELFQLIFNHYQELHLCERMKKKAIRNYTILYNRFKVSLNKQLGLPTVVDTVIEIAEDNKVAYGHNYWESIFEISMAQSPIFQNKFRQQTENIALLGRN